MKFSRIYLNRLQNQPAAADTVVVIDTLRSFTTAAVALAHRGAGGLSGGGHCGGGRLAG